MQVVRALHGTVPNPTIRSPSLDPPCCAGMSGDQLCDQDSVRRRQSMVPHQSSRQRHVLSGNAEIAAANAPVAEQLWNHHACGVGADREADALRRKDHRRVDADNVAVRVNERAS